MLFNFVGPSYQYLSSNFDSQRVINMYPATSETNTSKGNFILNPTPGRLLFANLAAQPIRGMWATVDRAFAVSYNILYEIFSDGTSIDRGHLLTFNGPVSITDNGLQLIIVDGTATGGWILNFSDNSYAQITAGGFPGGNTVTFLDGYFILNVPNTGSYQWSALYDGTLWDGADVANAEGSPDNLVAVITVHRQTWLVGGSTIEVIYNAGNTIDPFDRVQGVFIQYGSMAPFSVIQAGNTILWLGADTQGQNVVWMAVGYQPTRISTTAIEAYLSQYDTTTATAYAYQEDGHYFYILNIDGAPTSLVYDMTQKQWHERARWNSALGMYERDRANYHMFIFGKHLVSDFQTGEIYDQSLSYNNDDGTLIKRSRTLPYFTDDLEYLYFNWFQIDMQTGIGLATDTNPANTDPVINLRWSDDGGHTYSTEIACPVGKIGEYRTRARWNRLGRSRARVFEASIVANVPVYLISGHIDVSKGYA